METTQTIKENEKTLPWLVMYSNSGDLGIVEHLKARKAAPDASGILDFFVPVDLVERKVEGSVKCCRRFISGNYVFVKATCESIMKLRQEEPFASTLRFVRPDDACQGCLYVQDRDVRMLRHAVRLLEGRVEYFAPTSKELLMGDRVRIADGKLAGVCGVLECVKGHEGGRLIVSISDVLAIHTPTIAADSLQVLDFAHTSDGLSCSYSSRAYKKMRVLLEFSQQLLHERQANGSLPEASQAEAERLLKRYALLQLEGKMRLMLAEAITNIKKAMGGVKMDDILCCSESLEVSEGLKVQESKSLKARGCHPDVRAFADVQNADLSPILLPSDLFAAY